MQHYAAVIAQICAEPEEILRFVLGIGAPWFTPREELLCAPMHNVACLDVPLDRLAESALEDPSLAFLNRVLARLGSDPQFQRHLADSAAAGDGQRVLSLLDGLVCDADGDDADCIELDDVWLEELCGGRGALPLALVLLAGAVGSGHALPGVDSRVLSGLMPVGAGGGSLRHQAPWMAQALPLIRAFEGLALEAYLDPVGIATIGYGTIRYPDGQTVQLGDRISAEAAEQLLQRALLNHYAPALFEAIPASRRYAPSQQAALISFTYNVGTGALRSSTLRRRLLAGEEPELVISEELPLWCRGDGQVLPGLVRRRAAEVALFLSAQASQAG